MDEENILDFNFWPSFSDLMLSLVLILVLVLFLVSAVLNVGTVNLSHVEKNQQGIIEDIKSAFIKKAELNQETNNIKDKKKEAKDYLITVFPDIRGDIVIKNEPTLQKITFSSHILFPPDEIALDEGGKDVLSEVGKILIKKIDLIREIQIQGHADTTPTKYGSNMNLAAQRAISVFDFLKSEIKIDPAGHLMSITSFGEFKPTQRLEDDTKCSIEKIKDEYNKTKEQKEKNRRIELLLFYYY